MAKVTHKNASIALDSGHRIAKGHCRINSAPTAFESVDFSIKDSYIFVGKAVLLLLLQLSSPLLTHFAVVPKKSKTRSLNAHAPSDVMVRVMHDAFSAYL